MASTMLLDRTSWDLVVDRDGNIAVAQAPYALAQDAASACKTFEGELYYNTDMGVPYWQSILGQRPPISLLKAYYNAAALSVPGVVAARTFILTWDSNRSPTGQVQIKDTTGQLLSAGF